MADPLATSRPGRWRVARLVGQIRARWPRVKIVLRADSASRESEDHQLRRLLRECSLGPDSAVADRCEHGLDRVGGAQVIPMLGREVEEGSASRSLVRQATALAYLVPYFSAKVSHGGLRGGPRLGLPNVAKV
jgi:hypothetical protein